MKRFLVIGAGMQGVAAGYYLAKNGNGRVFFMDTNVNKAKIASEKINSLLNKNVATYISEPYNITFRNERTRKLIGSYHGIVSAATFKINLELTKLCIDLGTHMVDLGGNNTVVNKQIIFNSTAIRNNVTILPDSGLAPGLGNILARLIIDENADVHDIKILCGGLPEHDQFESDDPLKYKLVFSYEGLLNEYFEPVESRRNGLKVVEPGFSDLEEVTLEFDSTNYVLEAFLTSGGTSRGVVTSPLNIRNYIYKTLRYQGHRDNWEYINESERLEMMTRPEWKDIILLKVQGLKNGKVLQEFTMKTSECPVTGFSAMAQATAYPAAETLLLAVAGSLKSGVLTPDRVFAYTPEIARNLIKSTGLNIQENKTEVSVNHIQDMFGP